PPAEGGAGLLAWGQAGGGGTPAGGRPPTPHPRAPPGAPTNPRPGPPPPRHDQRPPPLVPRYPPGDAERNGPTQHERQREPAPVVDLQRARLVVLRQPGLRERPAGDDEGGSRGDA